MPDQYVPLLSKWASVGRTLRTAQGICDEMTNQCVDTEIIEKASWCSHELEELTPSLDQLHHHLRTELWKLQSKG